MTNVHLAATVASTGKTIMAEILLGRKTGCRVARTRPSWRGDGAGGDGYPGVSRLARHSARPIDGVEITKPLLPPMGQIGQNRESALYRVDVATAANVPLSVQRKGTNRMTTQRP